MHVSIIIGSFIWCLFFPKPLQIHGHLVIEVPKAIGSRKSDFEEPTEAYSRVNELAI